MTTWKYLLILLGAACAGEAVGNQPADAGVPVVDAGPPEAPSPVWSLPFDAMLFARALDVSCAPPDAKPGVEGCIAITHYQGRFPGEPGVPDSTGSYGSVLFTRFDTKGQAVWTKVLASGFAPDYGVHGTFVDDDLRVRLLANGQFVFSGSYAVRVSFGEDADPKRQELGPAKGTAPFVILFEANGTFDNWDDTDSEGANHAKGIAPLPDGSFLVAGRLETPLPETSPLAGATDGYLMTMGSDGSILRMLTFGGTRDDRASDVAADASGNAYVAGTFEQTMLLAGPPEQIAVGEDDAFVAKLDKDGKRQWLVQAGGIGHDVGGRVVIVPGGLIWTARVSRGAKVGATLVAEGGHVIVGLDEAGKVLWTRAEPRATGVDPLRLAAADDGSFAAFGDGFLGRYAADGTPLWARTGSGVGDVRGGSFTKDLLIVASTATGTTILGAKVADGGIDIVRGVVAAFAR